MSDLGKPIDGLIEPIVETMNKDQHFAASVPFGGCRKIRNKGSLIKKIRRNSHKILPRITWQGGGPLHLASLSRYVGRNGNGDRGIRHLICPVAVEHFASIGC